MEGFRYVVDTLTSYWYDLDPRPIKLYFYIYQLFNAAEKHVEPLEFWVVSWGSWFNFKEANVSLHFEEYLLCLCVGLPVSLNSLFLIATKITFWKIPRSLVVVLPAAVMASRVRPTDGSLVVTTRWLPIVPSVYTFDSPGKKEVIRFTAFDITTDFCIIGII